MKAASRLLHQGQMGSYGTAPSSNIMILLATVERSFLNF
jgi:hypothetical protein